VVLQTHHPQHPFVQALLSQSYPQIAKDLLAERAQAHLPPFGFSAWVMAEGKQLPKVRLQLEKLSQSLQGVNISCAGPIPALMHRRQYLYRELLWLQADTRTLLHQAVTRLLDTLNQPQISISGVRVIVDIDPQDMP
jgi:primosomal protein N' (replication factor Y)